MRAVQGLQVDDTNFPTLESTTGVLEKIKSGHTIEPGQVQGSNVTTFSTHSSAKGRLSRPYPVLGVWLDRFPEQELGKLLEQATTKTTAIRPPTTHPASILMKATNGVNSH